ncbi:MAG: type I glutamate--ammonia ligase [Sulfolobales archaeon]
MSNTTSCENSRLIIHYTDLAGFLRSVETRCGERKIVVFDGSSVRGFAEISRSDMILDYEPSTLRRVPWERDLYRAIGRVYDVSGKRFERDPRYVAEKTFEYMLREGYRALVGGELEFFVFNSVKIVGERSSAKSGFSISFGERYKPEKSYHNGSDDRLLRFRVDLSRYLEELGFGVETSHHEVATSQIELSLRAGDPVYIGDEIVTSKWVARTIARMNNLAAVFMPKPVYGENGSGMHLHISLWDPSGRVNMFSSGEKNELSDIARYFIGGLIEHCRSLAAIVAPTTNSYKRLVPGYEAPVYCVWGYYNRSASIRVPYAGNSDRVRIEFRPPDPTSNPYLAVSAVLLAGLDGIKRKIDAGEPFNGNVYKISPRDAREKGVKTLPRDLDEALDELESDREYLKPVFSDEIIESYVEIKRYEAREVNSRPHPHEFILYMDL